MYNKISIINGMIFNGIIAMVVAIILLVLVLAVLRRIKTLNEKALAEAQENAVKNVGRYLIREAYWFGAHKETMVFMDELGKIMREYGYFVGAESLRNKFKARLKLKKQDNK